MDGFDFIAEFDDIAARRILRAYWLSNLGSESFNELEKPAISTHRIFPLPETDADDPEAGLALVVHYEVKRVGFPENSIDGLEKGQQVDLALYAADTGTLQARLWVALAVSARIEIRYPGDANAWKFRKFGDFVSTTINLVLRADANATILPVGSNNNLALAIPPDALSVNKIWFFDNAEPEPALREVLNNMIGQLLPLIIPKPMPISMKLDELVREVEGVHSVSLPMAAFRSFDGTQEVTGNLVGEDRFARPGVRTIVAAGVAFDYILHPDRPQRASRRGGWPSVESLRARQWHLPAKNKQCLAISVSDWVLRYFNEVQVEPLVRRLFSGAICKQRGEEESAPNNPPKFTSPEGLAMYLPTGDQSGFTMDKDDNVVVVKSIANIRLDGTRIKTDVTIVQIQRGWFGLDFLQPDTDAILHFRFKFATIANDEGFLRPQIESLVVERTDGLFEQIVGTVFSTFQDLVTLTFTAIVDFIRDGDFNDGTKDAALNFGISVGSIFAPFILIFVQFFMPGVFSNLIDPVKTHGIKFFSTEGLLTFKFTEPPEVDASAANYKLDDGLIVFANLEFDRVP